MNIISSNEKLCKKHLSLSYSLKKKVYWSRLVGKRKNRFSKNGHFDKSIFLDKDGCAEAIHFYI